MKANEPTGTDWDEETPAPTDGMGYTMDGAGLDKDLQGLLVDLDRPVISWRPDPGSQVVGRVASMQMRENEYGPYPAVILDPGDGPLILVHCFGAILKNEVDRAGLDVGDRMAVRYVGQRGERGLKEYVVRIAKAATPNVPPA